MPQLAPEKTSTPGGTFITYVDDAGVLRVIAFDATERDNHQGTATASDYALDVNARVTDHVRADARRFSTEVVVTNTPIVPPLGHAGAVQSITLAKPFRDFRSFAQVSGNEAGFDLLLGPLQVRDIGATQVTAEGAVPEERSERVAAEVLQFATPFDRCKEVFDVLDALRDAGTPVTVHTRLREYREVVILSHNTVHAAEDATTIALDFQQIRRAVSQVIQVSPPVREPRAKKKKEAGAQGTYEADLADNPGPVQDLLGGIGKAFAGLKP